MILLWGLASEPPLAAVRTALLRLGVPNALIDQHDVLDSAIQLCVDSDVGGWIRTPGQTIDFRTVTAAYLRPYDPRRLPAIVESGPSSAAWQHAVAFSDSLWSWAELGPALIVNRPEAMVANNSKPYQLEQIRRLGFSVPQTCITTDPATAQAFWEHHGTVVYKSVSGTRSIVARLGPGHAQRLAAVAWCPTQFQEYIPGRDHRVHVVGSEVFACEVISEADDYRYPGGHTVEIQACCLPREVEDRCRRLATAMQLPVAGIDLRRSPEGDWYCFEVNPSPGFTYFQQGTNQPISEAIARLLAVGPGPANPYIQC